MLFYVRERIKSFLGQKLPFFVVWVQEHSPGSCVWKYSAPFWYLSVSDILSFFTSLGKGDVVRACKYFKHSLWLSMCKFWSSLLSNFTLGVESTSWLLLYCGGAHWKAVLLEGIFALFGDTWDGTLASCTCSSLVAKWGLKWLVWWFVDNLKLQLFVLLYQLLGDWLAFLVISCFSLLYTLGFLLLKLNVLCWHPIVNMFRFMIDRPVNPDTLFLCFWSSKNICNPQFSKGVGTICGVWCKAVQCSVMV